ncbi:MAG: hypothetical protein BWY57_03133 [Betaproteobacteria bacterium ADurb.Bin341]|nr:MAG: hypothetical protein BWY57_03133 [Betaproteobacteria bacterium ADurb.Bin341]
MPAHLSILKERFNRFVNEPLITIVTFSELRKKEPCGTLKGCVGGLCVPGFGVVVHGCQQTVCKTNKDGFGTYLRELRFKTFF